MNNNAIIKYGENHKETAKRIKVITAVIIAAAIAIMSAAVLAEHFSDPQTYETTIESLDDKRNDVLAMSASSASISTALTLLPNDIATPIADNLADLSTTLLVVLCAIFLEKYLLTLAGLITFRILIPLACVLFILFLFNGRMGFAAAAAKIAMLGICIVLLVPASTAATKFIEDTYAVSIQENVAEAEAAAEVIEENKEQDEKFLTSLFRDAREGAESMYDKVKNVLSNFIEAAAILIITSCIIPVLTLWLLLWAANNIIGIHIEVPRGKLAAFARSGSGIRKNIRRRALSRKSDI